MTVITRHHNKGGAGSALLNASTTDAAGFEQRLGPTIEVSLSRKSLDQPFEITDASSAGRLSALVVAIWLTGPVHSRTRPPPPTVANSLLSMTPEHIMDLRRSRTSMNANCDRLPDRCRRRSRLPDACTHRVLRALKPQRRTNVN